MGAGIVVPFGGPRCCLLGPAWDTVPHTWAATAKPGLAAVGCDVAEDGLIHVAVLLHLISHWAGDEVVLVAWLLWALLTRDVGPLGGESRTPPSQHAALLEVPPSIWTLLGLVPGDVTGGRSTRGSRHRLVRFAGYRGPRQGALAWTAPCVRAQACRAPCGPLGALLVAAVMKSAPNLELRSATSSPLPNPGVAVESPMLMGAGIVVPVEGPGRWLLGQAGDTAPGSWGAAVKPGAAVVGWDLQEDGLLHGEALLHLFSLWHRMSGSC